MFDFTTTTFIHDPNMIEANPGTTEHGNNKGSKNVLRLENKFFKVEDVVAIYKNPYVPAANAKLKVDVKGFMDAMAGTAEYADAKRFKLDFYLKRSGDNNSFYSNDFVFKGKDFHYEWTKKQNDATKVAKIINKINKLYDDIYMKVYTEKEGQKDVLIFENDNYGIFIEAELKVYLEDSGDCCTFREGGWTTVDALPNVIHGYCEAEECTVPAIPYKTSEDNEDYYNGEANPALGGWLISYYGVNGFGTYEQILKDLRLPTMENMRWTSLNESEMPIPGNLYTQYTIHQISCRGVLGGAAVGEVTHSKTTHVFFVPSCGCGNNDLVTTMDGAIEDAGMSNLVVDMGAVTKDPTPNPVDFETVTYDASVKADTTTADEHGASDNSNNGNG